MELSHLQSMKLRYLAKFGVLLSVSMVLGACVSSASQSIAEQVIETEPVTVEQSQPQVKPLPLNSELVYYVLMAEIAGQRGEIGLAADLYSKAAETVESPALAGRSTQVANFTRNQERINRALERWIEVDPGDADVYIMQTPFLMLRNEYDSVVKAVDKALGLAPERTRQYLIQVADNLSELAKPEQALNVIKQLKAYQANNPEALFVYARLAAFFKQNEDALTHVKQVLEQQADREDALILNAELLQNTDQGTDALAVLKPYANKESASLELRFAYAKLLGENGKIKQARAVFEQIALEQPDNEEALFALGLLALEDRDGELAKKYFSKLVQMGDPGKQASYFMALSEELNNNIEAALVWYASVPAASPRFQAAQTKYINLLADNGQLEKARLHLKLLRNEDPDRAKQYFVFEAVFLRDRGEYQSAYNVYTEALTAYPNDIELLYGRAMTAEPLGKLDVLEQDLNKILAVEPNNASALNALGYTLADKTDRYSDALVLIQKALVISPNDPFYLDSLGWVYYRMGKLEAAALYLKQAIAIQDDPEFVAHLGEVLWQQNKHEQAKQLWQKALEQAPDNVLLKETMGRFVQ
ncbi:MAG: tetratricopeptide repeat protein [Gammaproteobacteria bacterium]|nr:tetratricopeptide repeat protein [Gammaproteobacteria bacterium]